MITDDDLLKELQEEKITGPKPTDALVSRVLRDAQSVQAMRQTAKPPATARARLETRLDEGPTLWQELRRLPLALGFAASAAVGLVFGLTNPLVLMEATDMSGAEAFAYADALVQILEGNLS